jgi:hypothetical protein
VLRSKWDRDWAWSRSKNRDRKCFGSRSLFDRDGIASYLVSVLVAAVAISVRSRSRISLKKWDRSRSRSEKPRSRPGFGLGWAWENTSRPGFGLQKGWFCFDTGLDLDLWGRVSAGFQASSTIGHNVLSVTGNSGKLSSNNVCPLHVTGSNYI